MGSVREHTVIRVLDEGRFGSVSLIRIPGFKKEFVLKEIDLRDATAQEQRSAKLEAKLLETLRHENIVSYIESFQGSNGCLHIIMEYCRGGDLYTTIQMRNGQHFPEQQAAEWLSQICQALKYLHDRNIVHRDLKTKNVFLTENRDVRLGDLGIARVLKDKKDMARTLIGTPCYMSPEVFCQKPYNHKCDVWSLGCCMVEILTLKQAFSALTYEALKMKVLQGNVPAVPEHYNTEFVDLVLSFLVQNPDERPSVGDILLTGYMRHHNMSLAQVKVKRNVKPDKRPEKKLKNRETLGIGLKNGEPVQSYTVSEKLSSISINEHMNGQKSEDSCTECKTSSSSSISLNSVVTTPDINGNGDGNDNSQRTYTLITEEDTAQSGFKIPCIYVNCKTPNLFESAKEQSSVNSKENINPASRKNIFLSNHHSVAQSAVSSRKPPLKMLPKKPSTSMSSYKVPKNSGEISLDFLNHLHQVMKRARDTDVRVSNRNNGHALTTKLCLNSPSLPNLRDSCLFCEPDHGLKWRLHHSSMSKRSPCSCSNSSCARCVEEVSLKVRETGSVPVLPVLKDCYSVLPKVHDVLFPTGSSSGMPYNDVNIDNYLIKNIVTGNKNCSVNLAARERRRKREQNSQAKSAPASIERFPPITN